MEIEGYTIEEELGHSRYAVVYRANQQKSNRHVAIKVLRGEFASDTEYSRQFVRNAELVAKLQHPHIVKIYGVGRTADDAPFVCTRLLNGGDIASRKSAGKLNERLFVETLVAAGQALAYLHKRGLIHGAVKPTNILFDEAGCPFLTDFGQPATGSAESPADLSTDPYLSPEQLSGSDPSIFSDIYALGTTAFEVLLGFRPPRENAAPGSQPEPGAPKLPDKYAHWQAFFDRTLATQPQHRFGSAEDLVEALRQLLPESSDDDTASSPNGGALQGPAVDPEPDDRTRYMKPLQLEPEGGETRVMRPLDDGPAPQPVAGAGTPSVPPQPAAADRTQVMQTPKPEPADSTMVMRTPPIQEDHQGAGSAGVEVHKPISPDQLRAKSRDSAASGWIDRAEAIWRSSIKALGPVYRAALAGLKDKTGMGLALAQRWRDQNPKAFFSSFAAAASLVVVLLIWLNWPASEPEPESLPRDDSVAAGAPAQRDDLPARTRPRDNLAADTAPIEPEQDQPARETVTAATPVLVPPETDLDPGQDAAQAEQAEGAVDGSIEDDYVISQRLDVEVLLTQAAEDLQERRLTTPPGRNALDRYQAVLEIDPGNPQARAGLYRIVAVYLQWFSREMAKPLEAIDLDAADRYLVRAAGAVPDDPEVQRARSQLNDKKQQLVSELIRKGQTFVEERDRDQALASFRRVLRLDPRNGAAMAGLAAAEAVIRKPFLFQDTLNNGGQGPEMLTIWEGKYPVRAGLDQPQEIDVVTRFAISAGEITVESFGRFVEATGYRPKRRRNCRANDLNPRGRRNQTWQKPGYSQGDRHPVACVDFQAATRYAAWLSEETGADYRLPAEAEWLVAADGFGRPQLDANNICEFGNVADASYLKKNRKRPAYPCDDGRAEPGPVRQVSADDPRFSGFVGGLSEWGSDCWDPNSTTLGWDAGLVTDGDCGAGIIRGVSFRTEPVDNPLSYRKRLPEDRAFDSVGFRVVRYFSN